MSAEPEHAPTAHPDRSALAFDSLTRALGALGLEVADSPSGEPAPSEESARNDAARRALVDELRKHLDVHTCGIPPLRGLVPRRRTVTGWELQDSAPHDTRLAVAAMALANIAGQHNGKGRFFTDLFKLLRADWSGRHRIEGFVDLAAEDALHEVPLPHKKRGTAEAEENEARQQELKRIRAVLHQPDRKVQPWVDAFTDHHTPQPPTGTEAVHPAAESANPDPFSKLRQAARTPSSERITPFPFPAQASDSSAAPGGSYWCECGKTVEGKTWVVVPDADELEALRTHLERSPALLWQALLALLLKQIWCHVGWLPLRGNFAGSGGRRSQILMDRIAVLLRKIARHRTDAQRGSKHAQTWHEWASVAAGLHRQLQSVPLHELSSAMAKLPSCFRLEVVHEPGSTASLAKQALDMLEGSDSLPHGIAPTRLAAHVDDIALLIAGDLFDPHRFWAPSAAGVERSQARECEQLSRAVDDQWKAYKRGRSLDTASPVDPKVLRNTTFIDPDALQSLAARGVASREFLAWMGKYGADAIFEATQAVRSESAPSAGPRTSDVE